MSDHSNHKGFTLVELIVSMGIMAIILSVVISSQSTYTDSAALSNLADEIGLTISQAQAYGIGVREFSPGTSDFTASYGLVFSLLESDFNKSYISFADRNSNKIYDGDWSCQTGDGLECLKKTSIPRGNYIESICVVRTSGGDICTTGRVDITFTRPDTNAQLVFFNDGGELFNPANIMGAKITLKSPGGLTKMIVIYETGQISVQ